ncbi:MAG: aminopeptidase P family N-terminal domain-containing protein, partial [Thermodesulfobacteriota bacterium]|nr:aminopeptidase P family N-terminal domain-containing protein [Thermodesulfobacteriota bacterium]
MFEALEKISLKELELRWTRARKMLDELSPQAEGLVIFSRPTIYYMSGTLGNGLFWLPREGNPVLLLRRGIERAGLESSVPNIFSFRSYSDVPGILKDAGSPLGKIVAAEMGGLSWSLANLLTSRLPEYEFTPGDKVLALARSVKTDWELNKMRLCGERHKITLAQILPRHIKPGMSEREIS